MKVNLTGPELATYLAIHLTDLEFELLIRERIKNLFVRVHMTHEGFYEGCNSCRFEYAWNDKSEWRVAFGSTYKDTVSLSGEVLSITTTNCLNQWEKQNGNKLSLLLPAPTETVNEGGDAEWMK